MAVGTVVMKHKTMDKLTHFITVPDKTPLQNTMFSQPSGFLLNPAVPQQRPLETRSVNNNRTEQK